MKALWRDGFDAITGAQQWKVVTNSASESI